MPEDHQNATAVIIAYRKNRLNTRLIFGAPRTEIRRGWHRKLALFLPGDVFAYERWRGDQYGTQDWRLYICRAQGTGPITHIPGVLPGAELLTNISGKTRVKRALACLDQLRHTEISLEKQPTTRWRELGNLLVGGKTGQQIMMHLSAQPPC